jgi:hypothetical protein
MRLESYYRADKSPSPDHLTPAHTIAPWINTIQLNLILVFRRLLDRQSDLSAFSFPDQRLYQQTQHFVSPVSSTNTCRRLCWLCNEAVMGGNLILPLTTTDNVVAGSVRSASPVGQRRKPPLYLISKTNFASKSTTFKVILPK